LILRKTPGDRRRILRAVTLARSQRWIVGYLTLAAWLFALACTSVYACELGVPVQQHECCVTTPSIDAQCSSHCELEGQAPALGWPDFAQPAFAAPMSWVAALVPATRAQPPPDPSGASPPLTILLLRLRN
jgi:hypothetical protein